MTTQLYQRVKDAEEKKSTMLVVDDLVAAGFSLRVAVPWRPMDREYDVQADAETKQITQVALLMSAEWNGTTWLLMR
jgi:hypothetical protein